MANQSRSGTISRAISPSSTRTVIYIKITRCYDAHAIPKFAQRVVIMRIHNLDIRHSPGSIRGDLYFEFGEGWYHRGVRLDEYMGDLADCIKELDEDRRYVFRDEDRSREVRMQRDKQGVPVSFHGYQWPGDASVRLDYRNFRGRALEALQRYGDE